MKIYQDSSKMYMAALKSSRFREEFTYHEPKMPNVNNLYINKENIVQPPTFCKLVNINVGNIF